MRITVLLRKQYSTYSLSKSFPYFVYDSSCISLSFYVTSMPRFLVNIFPQVPQWLCEYVCFVLFCRFLLLVLKCYFLILIVLYSRITVYSMIHEIRVLLLALQFLPLIIHIIHICELFCVAPSPPPVPQWLTEYVLLILYLHLSILGYKIIF